MLLTAVVPFALPGYLVALTGFATLVGRAAPGPRRWYAGGALVALVGVLAHAVLLAPAYLGGHAGGDPDLTVVTLNLRKGEADPGDVLALVRSTEPDVLVLEEVSAPAREALRDAGLDAALTHSEHSDGDVANGTWIFSRHPLIGTQVLPVRNGALTAIVDAPRPFRVFAVHTAQPIQQPGAWARDWRALHRYVAAAIAADPAGTRTIVAGDFNATLDHRPVRALLDQGFVDAARRANAGWQPTWPGLLGGFGLIAIDHVFLRGAGLDAISISTAAVDGTDHRALIARLRLAQEASAPAVP